MSAEEILRLWLEEVHFEKHEKGYDEEFPRFGDGRCHGCDFEEATRATCEFLGLPVPEVRT